MQIPTEVESPRDGAMQPSDTIETMAGAALGRRRALLEGLGKGSAIIAAVTPIKTLAITSSATANGKMCTASGVGSAVHSTATSVPTCGGLSPGWYKTPSHWPSYNATSKQSSFVVGSKTITELFGAGKSPGVLDVDPAFNTIFSGGSGKGIFYILKNNANSAEFHWIAALLNAVFYSGGGWPKAPYVYPYTPAEILNLYTNNNAAGLTFIKGYLETL